jgi:hypothetical protein
MKTIITGHSLGAAEAVLYAYDRVYRGLPVDALYLFGCPQPGNAAIAAGISTIPVVRSIQNRVGPHFPDYDLVTSVPFEAGPFLDYAQPHPFELISEAPPPDDKWGLFRYHHAYLYQNGVRKLPGIGAEGDISTAIDAVQNLYGGVGTWTVENFVDGRYWGVRRLFDGSRLLVFRGSATLRDWLHDFTFEQISLHGARVSAGFWSGPSQSGGALDAALA